MTPNFAAFLAVIRACEGTSGPNGYRTLFGGGLFDNGFVDHPRIVVNKSGYKSTAAGAYQALQGTWDDFIKAEGPHDFSPSSQDLFARWCIQRRGALADVEAGRLRAAISKCNKEWASLPGSPYGQPVRTLAYCEQIFHFNGGTQTDGDSSAPSKPAPQPTTRPAPSAPPPTAPPPKEPSMGDLALFAPILAQLIPQISNILKPESAVAKRNVALGETIANTIVSAAQATNLQDAVEKMQADPAVLDTVKKAVVTEPAVMGALQLVEVGGGAKAAAERDLTAAQNEKPFWKTSAVFWVSIMLVPMVYWYVGSSVVGGVEIAPESPWYVQLLKVFGTAWSADARSGLANLVIGLVLGGICGVYFGISVTQQKQQPTTQKEA